MSNTNKLLMLCTIMVTLIAGCIVYITYSTFVFDNNDCDKQHAPELYN